MEELINNVIPNEVIMLIGQYYPIYIEFGGSKLGLNNDGNQVLIMYLTKVLIENDKNKRTILSEKLLYDGSRVGYTAKAFHEKCDHVPNTLTIVKTVRL